MPKPTLGAVSLTIRADPGHTGGSIGSSVGPTSGSVRAIPERGQAYDIWGDSTPTSTIDMIDVIYMRYWYCGSLAGTYAPSPYYNSPGDGYFFGYTALNNCGWQADSYVEFYEAGRFDDLSYIDDP